MTADVVARIRQFNQDRIADLVQQKYFEMSKKEFTFFRGTCHLFYEDWPEHTPLNNAPLTWLCGDLHLENFGSYKGDDRQVHFGVNDFDDALLAPCTWDIARLLTSLLVAAPALKIERSDAQALCGHFLNTYINVLSKAKVQSVTRKNTTGSVKQLLDSVSTRERAVFLDDFTELKGTVRRFKRQDARLPAALASDKDKVAILIKCWGATQEGHLSNLSYSVLDVVHRIAGTGSRGVERYAILIEGKGSPNGNYILDLKEERPSPLQRYVQWSQPAWGSSAERAVSLQKRFGGTPPALLSAVDFGGKSFLLRELQPLNDRLNLVNLVGKSSKLQGVIEIMAQVVGSGHLRGSGQQGSAVLDDLRQFAHESKWRETILDYAQYYAVHVNADYHTFVVAYNDGKLKV